MQESGGQESACSYVIHKVSREWNSLFFSREVTVDEFLVFFSRRDYNSVSTDLDCVQLP